MSYERIKALADEAVALQNKAAMEAALREIGHIVTQRQWQHVGGAA